MNDCGAGAKWIIVGACISSDGEAMNLVLGACDRHVLGLRQYVDEVSAELDESSVVMGVEAFHRYFQRQMGLEIGTLVAAAG